MMNKLAAWWSHPRFAKARPMLIDTALPAGCYYILHSWLGHSALFAFSVAAVLLCARVGFTVARERRIDSFQILVLASILVSLALAIIADDSRIALLRGSIYSTVLGVGCVVTTFVGTPLLERIMRPGLALTSPGLEEAWEQCWDTDHPFRRRVRQLNLLYGASFLASAATRAWVVYHTSEGVAVVASSMPGLVISGVVAIATAVLAMPLVNALEQVRKEHAEKAEAGT
jgi:intracellular septation protein A